MLGRLVWFVLPATFSRFVVPTTFLGRFVVPTLFLNVGLSMAEQPVEEERNMAQEALRTSLGVFYGREVVRDGDALYACLWGL